MADKAARQSEQASLAATRPAEYEWELLLEQFTALVVKRIRHDHELKQSLNASLAVLPKIEEVMGKATFKLEESTKSATGQSDALKLYVDSATKSISSLTTEVHALQQRNVEFSQVINSLKKSVDKHTELLERVLKALAPK